MGKQGKKESENTSDNSGNVLQIPGAQGNDHHEELPLTFVNNGALQADTPGRKTSRAISKVSMSSDDGKAGEKETV